jgi:DNA-binding transcriptional regulator YhcF (GntR family)
MPIASLGGNIERVQQAIRISNSTGVPVFRQIAEQIVYMIEMGQLNDGDRLPSSRVLADNLQINRHTVARAYTELRDSGLVEGQGRHGMVVRGAARARARLAARESAHEVLATAVARCLELGLEAEEIASLAYQHSLHTERNEVQVTFIECNLERAEAFAAELGDALEISVKPLVLGDFAPEELEDSDLVVTTFFHLTEVRRLVRDLEPEPELVAIVVAPHLKTLVRLSQIPPGHRVGIFYTTAHQAHGIQRWVADAGVEKVDVISDPDDPALDQCDLVIVPSENPELARQLDGRTPLVEFGNVLDAGSIQVVSDALDDMRERRRDVTLRTAAAGSP